MMVTYEIVAENHTGTLSRITRLLESRNLRLHMMHSKNIGNDLSQIRISLQVSGSAAEFLRLLFLKIIDVHEVKILENAEMM